MTKKQIILLFLITLLGALLRLRGITVNPPNINTDEAAIGYNAYSILKTGKDEYGQSFPLAFRSFDDYKPPLYVYMTVPSVAIFGLNEFAVRFPSAILGIAAIVITYFLTTRLLKNSAIGLAASFLLAISPWHIQFTRTAYETGSNAFFTSLGLLFFFKGIENKWFWILSGLIFGLQTHLYQASKIFVPLLTASFLVIFFRQYNPRRLVLFFVPLILIFLPVILLATTPNGMIRFKGTSIFTDPKAEIRHLAFTTADWLGNDNKSVMLFHPTALTYYQDILIGYLTHFRPDFLFTGRENSRVAYVPDVGLMHLWELPFLLSGFYYLFRQKNKQAALFLSSWFLISPIPASVTTGIPNSVRTAVILPVIQMITAYGLINLFPKLSRLLKIAVFTLILYLLAFYVHMLLVHAPTAGAQTWYSGYKKMVTDSIRLSPNYKKVIVSTLFDQPQVFYLFYLKYDPATYLSLDGGTVGGGFGEQGNHLGNKFYFHTIDWFKSKQEQDTLLVAAPSEVPVEAKDHIIGTYYSLDGKLLAYFLETK